MDLTISSRAASMRAGLAGAIVAIALAGCSSEATSPSAQATAALDIQRAAELDARAQELAQREAQLAEKERAQGAAAQRAEAAKAEAPTKTRTPKSTSSKSSTVVAARTQRAATSVEVPAGTQLSLTLLTDLSTKTAKQGDAVEARLASDLVVNDRRVAPAGARVTGSIADVVSGSNAIGTVPMLGLKFEQLELADGRHVPISGEFSQQGKSEKARDTAKILGGAAAGAILGHQVKGNDTGTIVGGLLGGAAGAVAAKKTGTEVELVEGSALTVTLGRSIQVASM